MRALVTKNVYRDAKLAFSTDEVDIYYKWSSKITWLQFFYKEKFNDKIVLNFYVVPSNDNSCIYMAYIPYLDGLGKHLKNKEFNWEELFNQFPTLAKMFRRAGRKEISSSYISFVDVNSDESKRVGMVCMDVKNHPYPNRECCLLDAKYLNGQMLEEVGRKLQNLLDDVASFYSELKGQNKTDWRRFLVFAGKAAALLALVVIGGDIVDGDIFGELGEFSEDIDVFGNTDCDLDGISNAEFDGLTVDGVDRSQISFGSSENNAEIENKIKHEYEQVEYYEKEVRNSSNASPWYQSHVKNKLNESLDKIKDLKKQL